MRKRRLLEDRNFSQLSIDRSKIAVSFGSGYGAFVDVADLVEEISEWHHDGQGEGEGREQGIVTGHHVSDDRNRSH